MEKEYHCKKEANNSQFRTAKVVLVFIKRTNYQLERIRSIFNGLHRASLLRIMSRRYATVYVFVCFVIHYDESFYVYLLNALIIKKMSESQTKAGSQKKIENLKI